MDINHPGYYPQACGFSMNFGGVILCRLNTAPCKEPCIKKKQDENLKSIAESLKSYSQELNNNER